MTHFQSAFQPVSWPAFRPVAKGLSALVALALLASCSDDAPVSEPEPAIRATVEAPQRESVTLWDDYVGRFEAVRRVEIRPRVSGYLQRVHFQPGALVEEGDMLVSIDPRPFQAEITRIEAEIAQARSLQSLAQSRTRRAQTLLEARAGSREEYEETLQAGESAEAQIAAAEARLERARLDLEFTRIRAPIAGRVGEDLVNAGNLVTEGTSLLTTIVSVDPIYFAFTGSEQDYLNYSRLSRAGQRESSRDAPNPVRIRLADEDDYRIEGRMDFVNNAVDEGTATISARAVVENPDGFLTPGLFGQMRLYGRDPFVATLIPEKLIQYDQSQAFVWTLDAGDAARRTYLELGRRVDGERVIVEGGLEADDRLVTSNVQALRPGARVEAQVATQSSVDRSADSQP